MDDDEYAISKVFIWLYGSFYMKDFLTVYNKMAETCFNHCIENFNCRDLTSFEEKCIENCSSKSLGVNHKLMVTYIDIQPEIVNKRTDEMQKQQNIIEAQNIEAQNLEAQNISNS